MTRRTWRSLLASIVLIVGGIALSLGFSSYALRFGRWMAGNGIRGIWSQAALAFLFLAAFTLLCGLAIGIAGTRSGTTAQVVTALVFCLAAGAVMLGYVVITVQYLAPLLKSLVGPTLRDWVLPTSLVAGLLGVGFAADRVAPRLGIELRKGRQRASRAA
jgi:hypothetical protein